ncbi:hypothetical protein B0F90DRAFT_400768 [Multifurca ochricompacta]|uniref:Uncharacterized protein n=1 Tax=Multifurca ochricompacta TaxID=376703 RepID=A0AAD4M3R8_9AGAM|nr:hypothetical protein B0F90DRAFT_400768 [Multifurca ochricompacta]
MNREHSSPDDFLGVSVSGTSLVQADMAAVIIYLAPASLEQAPPWLHDFRFRSCRNQCQCLLAMFPSCHPLRTFTSWHHRCHPHGISHHSTLPSSAATVVPEVGSSGASQFGQGRFPPPGRRRRLAASSPLPGEPPQTQTQTQTQAQAQTQARQEVPFASSESHPQNLPEISRVCILHRCTCLSHHVWGNSTHHPIRRHEIRCARARAPLNGYRNEGRCFLATFLDHHHHHHYHYHHLIHMVRVRLLRFPARDDSIQYAKRLVSAVAAARARIDQHLCAPIPPMFDAPFFFTISFIDSTNFFFLKEKKRNFFFFLLNFKKKGKKKFISSFPHLILTSAPRYLQTHCHTHTHTHTHIHTHTPLACFFLSLSLSLSVQLLNLYVSISLLAEETRALLFGVLTSSHTVPILLH